MMTTRTPTSPARALPLALLLAVLLAGASAAQEGAAAAVPAGPSGPADAQAGPGDEVQVVGDGDQRLFLVRHDDSWSMHAENLQAQALFEHWHQVGGPRVEAKNILDYPFTLSVHHLPAERIVERVLEGFGFTLHYDAGGRLDVVRVYSAEATRMYKTPRLTESLSSWRQVEEPASAASAAPAGADAATPSTGLPGQ